MAGNLFIANFSYKFIARTDLSAALQRTAYLWLLVSLLVSGCTLNIERRSEKMCPTCLRQIVEFKNGLSAEPLLNNLSPIMAYSHNIPPLSAGASSTRLLHIYLEGDGMPFLRPNIPAPNPNSATLLALQLMQLDSAPGIYLNRPCYGLNKLPMECHTKMWTEERYSAATVQHMNAALDQLKIQLQVTAAKIVFVGHSGGGALALLMAAHRQDVVGVVTLAGNLDTAAWTQLHGFSPLHNSLNPAQQTPLPPDIKRLHIAGALDTNIPFTLLKATAAKDPEAQFIVLADVTHTQGWTQAWPMLLQGTVQDMILAKKVSPGQSNTRRY